MNFASCRRLVSLLMYCGVAVLVIVNGQSTTDDDVDKDEINRLMDIVIKSADKSAKLEAKITKLEDQLTTTSAAEPDASKFSIWHIHHGKQGTRPHRLIFRQDGRQYKCLHTL